MIADPAAGVRSLSRKELGANWTDGIMLLLVPDENRFYEQKSDQISGFGRFLRRAWPYRYLLLAACRTFDVSPLFSNDGPFQVETVNTVI